MTDVDLPDLDAIPTTPPPPPSPEMVLPPRVPRRQPRPERPSSPFWKVVALILAVQAALVSSTLLVAVGKPSVLASVFSLVLTNVWIMVVLARSR
jgi:hypothetical protein